MNEFYLTQTSLKDLENDETCPWRWKKQWIDREIKFKSNENMDKGSYFEGIVLGSGAVSGQAVTDLPRLLSGEKSAEHKRIDEQAARVTKMLFDTTSPEYLGLSVVRTQLELLVGNKKGTIDIEAVDEEVTSWIVDLKLTKDLTSDRTKYSWGNNWEDMDFVQLTHYADLYTEATGKKPRVGILVVDYSPQKRVTFGELVISDEKLSDKNRRFSAGENTISLYNQHGWVKTPNIKECESCPLKCDERLNGSQLIKQIINY